MRDIRNLNDLSGTFFTGNSFNVEGQLVRTHAEQALQNYSTYSNAIDVEVRFSGIEQLFVEYSKTYEVAVGAVAWLTNKRILESFAKMKRTAFVVQKEDLLRKDTSSDSNKSRAARLRALYDALPPFDYSDFSTSHPGQQEESPYYSSAAQHWLFDGSGNYQLPAEAVRCLGYGREKDITIPNLHHKFVVFGYLHDGLVMIPDRVVTGSFNLTENAVNSRENVLSIGDAKICKAYLGEWAQLWCLSEELDWKTPSPARAYRYMGT